MPNYTELDDRAARQMAINVANRCRAVGRPVTWKEINSREYNGRTIYREGARMDRELLHRAVVLQYLTVYKFSNTSLYMPFGWGFGPPRKGCCR